LDIALKQRLVGASVIIALAVIFVPMIFNDSSPNLNQSISIEIPDEPNDLKHKVLSIDSHSDGENILQSNSQDESIKINVAPIEKQESILEVVNNSKSNTQQETNKEAITNQPTVEQTKVKIKQPIKPKQKPAQEKTNTSTKISTDESSKTRYRIKLGSFSQQKNAQQLKAKIIHGGYSAVVEKDTATGLFKVFSQQLDSLPAAQAHTSKLQKLKLNIGKTNIEKMNEQAQIAAELQLDTGWILQIGSFSSKENALKLRNKIRVKGFVSFVDEINKNKQQRYRVRIGPFATREEAISEQNKIRKSMNLKGLVKPHEKLKVINS